MHSITLIDLSKMYKKSITLLSPKLPPIKELILFKPHISSGKNLAYRKAPKG